MKKNDKHEPYCGCHACKPTGRALVILKPEEMPLLEKEAGAVLAALPTAAAPPPT